MKDVLMMDMLPSSIGVLTWDLSLPAKKEEEEDKGRGEGAGEEEDCRYFEPVLHRGDIIPSVGVRTFTLADLKQKNVSIDVYEEIEEYVMSTPSPLPVVVTVSGREISAETAYLSPLKAAPATLVVATTKTTKKEVKYRYDLIGTYDFIVPKPLRKIRKGEMPKVDVIFTMSAEGALVFSVRPHMDPKEEELEHGSGPIANENIESSNMIWVLGSYLSLMFVLYVIVKILIQSPATKELIDSLSVKTAPDL